MDIKTTRALQSEPSKYLKEKEAAKYLNLSQRTLQAWRNLCKGPRVTRFGNAIRYHKGDLDAFAAEGQA